MHGNNSPDDRDEFKPRFGWAISTIVASVFWIIECGPAAFAHFCGRLLRSIGFTKLGVNILAIARAFTNAISHLGLATLHSILRLAAFSKVPEFGHRMLTAIIFYVQRTAAFIELKVAESIGRSKALKVILLPFIGVYLACKSIAFFGGNWVYTRSLRTFVLGLPAVVLLMLLFGCLVQIPLFGVDEKAKSYELAIWHAIKNEEFELANFYYRKLYKLRKQPKDETIYRSAVTLDAEGKTDEAIRQMETISPTNEPGFAPGHSWIAAKKIKAYLGVAIPTSEVERISKHLHHALAQNPTDIRSAILLARLQMQSGDILSSHQTLLRHAENSSHAVTSAEISSIFAQLGDTRSAKRFSNDTLRRLGHHNSSPADELSTVEYFAWARALESLGKFDEAFSILKKAYATYPDDGSLKSATITAGLRLDAIHAQRMSDSQTRLALLEDLVKIAPNSGVLMDHIGRIAKDESHTLQAQAIDLLHLAINELGSAAAHKPLAECALKSNNQTEARRHFEEQVEKDSNDADACNNAAWMLAHTEPVDLAKAQKWIERAIDLDAANPHYRDTYGQILVKMNRYEDAAVELELALNGMPNKHDTHSALSKCYKILGKDELAAAHQRMSENR